MLVYNIEGLQIQQYTWNIIDSNSYLLAEGKQALLIDAVDSQELYEALIPIDLLTIILTHSHFDHICGLNQLRKIKKCTVIASSRCSEKMGNKTRNMSSTGNAFMAFYRQKSDSSKEVLDPIDRINVIEPFICQAADVSYEESMELEWEGHNIELQQFYGHSDDSTVVTLDNRLLFSGDTLMNIPTTTRFPSGSTARFWEESIPRFQSMNIKYVCPGHGCLGRREDMLATNINNKPKRYRKA